MISKELTIRNRNGLHARPASLFVSCARRFASEITVSRSDTDISANAKSIIKLLALGASYGTVIRICANGADEGAALDALVSLVESNFNEN